MQYPLFFAPKDFGMKAALFADAGSVWDYRGLTSFTAPGQATQTITPHDNNTIRSSVGAGIVWDSPFGPLRVDYAIALTKDKTVDPNTGSSVDRVQQFRFSGGTKF